MQVNDIYMIKSLYDYLVKITTSYPLVHLQYKWTYTYKIRRHIQNYFVKNILEYIRTTIFLKYLF